MSATDRTVIAELTKNRVETLVVSIDRYNGHDLIDVRTFAVFGESAEAKPTKKGVSIKVVLLPDLIAALQAAEAEARKRGLLADDEGGR